MTELKFIDVYDPLEAQDAIINDRMEGLRQDYLVLHCLLRKYKIKSCFEIGTHTGFGTKIIKNAIGDGLVISLDLPDEEYKVSLQHPLSEGKPGVGYECNLEFVQVRGDSRNFHYLTYPCEAFYIDGEHTRQHVEHEVKSAMEVGAKLIILHDADMPEVWNGLVDAVYYSDLSDGYHLYRVTDTRVAYILKRS